MIKYNHLNLLVFFISRNAVQFQAGLSLSDFIQACGREEQCFLALYKGLLNWMMPT